MDKTWKKRIAVYFGIAIIATFLYHSISCGQTLLFGNKIMSIMGVFLISMIFLLIAEIMLTIVHLRKRVRCREMLRRIGSVANSIKLPNGTPMFDVREQNFALCDSINNQNNGIKNAIHDSRHIVYHSTTAKKHINWIEFVFWYFLKRLHDELDCKIVISLHYDEKARETGVATHKEITRYNDLFRAYSQIAKTIIGNDITVIDEKDFRGQRKYSREFSVDFHDKYVKCVLEYVKQLDRREIDYKGLLRKISYIESVFPIMAYSKSQGKSSRIYVLDRELAQEVWWQSPFIEFKSTHGIFFITAQTIRGKDDRPLRIFSPNDTININDSPRTITKKLVNLDQEMKDTIYSLLYSAVKGASSSEENVKAEGDIDNLIINLICEINATFHFGEIE